MNETTRYLFQIDNSLAIANKLVEVLKININNTEVTNKGYFVINNINKSLINEAIEILTGQLKSNYKDVKVYNTPYNLTSDINIISFLMRKLSLTAIGQDISIISFEYNVIDSILTAKYTVTKQDDINKDEVIKGALTALRNAVALEEENYKCTSKVLLSFI